MTCPRCVYLWCVVESSGRVVAAGKTRKEAIELCSQYREIWDEDVFIVTVKLPDSVTVREEVYNNLTCLPGEDLLLRGKEVVYVIG